MTNYIMRFDINVGLAWEYRFKAESDKMALDYAAKHAMWLKHNLAVFKQETDDEWPFLARIEVDIKVTARIIPSSGKCKGEP